MSADNDQKLIFCSSCCIPFKTIEERNEHFKTDYHLFNLKRKALSMEPVSLEKYQQIKDSENAPEAVLYDYYCSVCKKHYSTENQMKEHERSKKHMINLRVHNCTNEEAIHKTVVDDDEDSEEEKKVEKKVFELDEKKCLFCEHESDSCETNINHMQEEHGFYILNVEYCTDIVGLIKYLQNKVMNECNCIYCLNEQTSFHSHKSVWQHMNQLGHCKMVDTDEYDEFYDYSQVPDNDVSIVSMDEYSMTLSNGKTIGNRTMNTYYKQNVKPEDTRACVAVNENRHSHQNPINYASQLPPSTSKALINVPDKVYQQYVSALVKKQNTSKATIAKTKDDKDNWAKEGQKNSRKVIKHPTVGTVTIYA